VCERERARERERERESRWSEREPIDRAVREPLKRAVREPLAAAAPGSKLAAELSLQQVAQALGRAEDDHALSVARALVLERAVGEPLKSR
jgi:hypothetical protein